MPHFYDTCAGPIEGLYLPPVAWEVLRRENIQSLDHFRANAHQLEQFDGIGPEMARMIRLALAYATPFDEQTSSTKQYDAWSANSGKRLYGTRPVTVCERPSGPIS